MRTKTTEETTLIDEISVLLLKSIKENLTSPVGRDAISLSSLVHSYERLRLQ